jgi:hypothetical protein
MAPSDRRISDEAVKAKTGRTPPEWFEILDREGAREMPHGQIAELLYGKYEIDGWWAQMVTVSYEQERGLRDKHQKPNGYEISGNKTLPVPLDALFAAWQDEAVRGRWLGETALTIRRATPNKSMRITWPDQTHVDVNFYAKGDTKSQVSVQHGKLPDAEAAARMKSWWAGALERLRAELG